MIVWVNDGHYLETATERNYVYIYIYNAYSQGSLISNLAVLAIMYSVVWISFKSFQFKNEQNMKNKLF